MIYKKGLITILILSILFLTSAKNSIAAVIDPPAAGTPDVAYSCLGDALAEYLIPLIDAKRSGELGNMKLLTPAFNMTSGTLPGISAAFRQSLIARGYSLNDVDGIAGNLYNAGGQTMQQHMTNNVIPNFGSSTPIYLTESGNHNSNLSADLPSTMSTLLSNNENIQAALLFNALLTNPDPNFNYHGLTQSQITQLCNEVGPECQNLGFNLGTPFQSGGGGGVNVNNETNAYNIANNLNMGYTLQILQNNPDSINNAVSAMTGYMAANPNAHVIIRIGVGGDSGGFNDPAEYTRVLKQIANTAGIDSSRLLAIGGPNEPDAENWASPECYLMCPNGLPTIALDLCPLIAAPSCQGPIRLELTKYQSTWTPIPFTLSARLFADINDSTENDIPDSITTILTIKSAGSTYTHTDFGPMVDQRVGSLDPADISNYIGKSEGKFNAAYIAADDEATMPSQTLPLHFVLDTPGISVPAAWWVSTQNSQKPNEAGDDFTRRYFTTQNGTDVGTKSYIPNPLVIGCIQKTICDPKLNPPQGCEDGEICPPSNCLKIGTTDYCDLTDDKLNCQSKGKVFPFLNPIDKPDGINMSEQTDVQAKKKIFSYATQYMVMPPKAYDNDPSLALNRPGFAYNSTNSNAEAINENYKNDDYLAFIAETARLQADPKRKEILVEKNKVTNQDLSKIDDTSDNSSEEKKINIVAQARAASAPTPNPWGDEAAYSQCDGLRVIVENKGDFYAVKAWSSLPESCGDLSDYGLIVNYYYNGLQVGGCSFPMIGGSQYIERYKADGTDKQKYGTSISDIGSGACSVPVSPQAGGTVTAEVIITNSHGEDTHANPSCRKDPFCKCEGPQCTKAACTNSAGVAIPCPTPVINCSLCNSWAPPEYCATFTDTVLNPTENCVDGNCVSLRNGADMKFDHSSAYEDHGNPVQVAFDAAGDFFQNLMQGYNDIVYKFSCDIDRNELGLYNGSCGFERATFTVHAYIPTILANMELNTTSVDMQLYNAIGHVPYNTDKFFEMRHSMQEETLVLGSGGTPEPGGDELDVCTSPDDRNCVELDVNIAVSTANYQLQFFTHDQQVREHCAVQAMYSYPGLFPASQSTFCKNVLNELRPADVVDNLLNEKTRFDIYAVNSWEQDAKLNDLANKPTETIIDNSQIKQLTNLPEKELDTPIKTNIQQGAQKYFDVRSEYDNNATQLKIMDEISARTSAVLNKYIDIYGYETITKAKSVKDLPKDMQQDLETIKQDIKQRYNI